MTDSEDGRTMFQWSIEMRMVVFGMKVEVQLVGGIRTKIPWTREAPSKSVAGPFILPMLSRF
jgi:hypothetical protein